MTDTIPTAPSTEADQPVRSKFITVLSWVLIVYFGINILFSILSVFLFRYVLDTDLLGFEYRDSALTGVREHFSMLVHYLYPVLWIAAVQAVLLFISAIGLLHRHNWARIAIIVLLIASVVESLLSAGFSIYVMFGIMQEIGPESVGGIIGGVVGGGMSATFYLAIYGFIIFKLTRPDVRAEFS